jgi:hypothetical protein
MSGRRWAVHLDVHLAAASAARMEQNLAVLTVARTVDRSAACLGSCWAAASAVRMEQNLAVSTVARTADTLAVWSAAKWVAYWAGGTAGKTDVVKVDQSD